MFQGLHTCVIIFVLIHADVRLPLAPRSRPRPRPPRPSPQNINLGTITTDARIATGEASECTNCGACASLLSKLVKVGGDDSDAYEWNCEFCGTKQVLELDEAELPVAGENSIDYIMEPAPAAPVAADGAAVTREEIDGLVLFVVDTSGSMVR